MSAERDIETLDDIKLLVNTFYGNVRKNELIGPIFNEWIADRWPEHLEKMYRFWQTILLSEHTYHGSPFPPHIKLPITTLHFETWLQIFFATVDLMFAGEKAEEAKYRGQKMAEMFNYKLDYIRKSSGQPIN
jgi:hemoglobin